MGSGSSLAAQFRGEVFQSNLVSFGHDDSAFDGVAQFAEVARPWVGADSSRGLFGKPVETASTDSGKMFEVMLREANEVVWALPQRRHFRRNHIESKIQVF